MYGLVPRFDRWHDPLALRSLNQENAAADAAFFLDP